MGTKKIKLDAYEQSIEDALARGEFKPVTGKKKAELLAKFRLAHENLKKGRGGARPGAGRKPLGHVPTSLALTPEVRNYLTRKAGGKRGISAVANRIFVQVMKRDRALAS